MPRRHSTRSETRGTNNKLSYNRYAHRVCVRSLEIVALARRLAVRMKTDIEPLSDKAGLANLMKLKPVTFKWKDPKRAALEGEQSGFIAQDVEKVYPQSVRSAPGSAVIIEADGSKATIEHPRSLKYMDLIAPLVKAVQELKIGGEGRRQAEGVFRRHARSRPEIVGAVERGLARGGAPKLRCMLRWRWTSSGSSSSGSNSWTGFRGSATISSCAGSSGSRRMPAFAGSSTVAADGVITASSQCA
jgi:hypothetical protein